MLLYNICVVTLVIIGRYIIYYVFETRYMSGKEFVRQIKINTTYITNNTNNITYTN